MSNSQGISYEDLAERIGDQRENNGLLASRMPPQFSTGLHPQSFYGVYDNGGLMNILRSELGDPSSVPKPTLAFNQSAMKPDDGLASLITRPKLG